MLHKIDTKEFFKLNLHIEKKIENEKFYQSYLSFKLNFYYKHVFISIAIILC